MSDLARKAREAARRQDEAALTFQTPPAEGYLLSKLADEIERLRAEVAMWKKRYEAVQADFERTLDAWDAEVRERDCS